MDCPACQAPLERHPTRPEWVCPSRHRTMTFIPGPRWTPGRCADAAHGEPMRPVDGDGRVWWCADGHYLLVQGPKTIDHLSPSALSTAEQCMYRYWSSYVMGRKEPPKVPTEVGTFAHEILEHLGQEPDGQRDLDRAKRIAAARWSDYAASWPFQALRLDQDDTKRFKWDAIRAVECLLEEHPLNGLRIVATEQAFQLTLSGTPIHGKIDLTVEEDDGLAVIDYKGLALDVPLPTPAGWTTMGDVAVGDYLLDADGQPTRVVAKSQVHHRPCYRITFDDGESIVCDDQHLWNVGVDASGNLSRYVDKTLATPEIAEALAAGARVRVTNPAPLDLPEMPAPLVDPYVLGAWLGDGSAKSGVIHVGAEDRDAMLAELERRGESAITVRQEATSWCLTPGTVQKDRCYRGHGAESWPASGQDHCRACAADRTAPKVNAPLVGRLRELGVLGDKHIPAAYLRASAAQRLELLRGLMDTDGYWHKTKRNAVFCNANRRLVAGVEELVASLGWRYYTFTPNNGAAWYVKFTPVGHNPFSLPRKSDDVRLEGTAMARRRMIRTAERVPTVETQCIAVDSPTSTFLCGRRMVPTHNTGAFPAAGLARSVKDSGSREKYDEHVRLVWKTEKEKLRQAHIYVAATRELHQVEQVTARLVYCKPGDSGVLYADPADTRLVMHDVRHTWQAVQAHQDAGIWPHSPGPLCGWCPFLAWPNGDGTHEFCPAGVGYARQRMESRWGWTKKGSTEPVPAVVTIRGLDPEQRRVAFEASETAGYYQEAA